MAAGQPPQIFTIPSGIPFARALCMGILARTGPGTTRLADTLVLVPTRRATRALHDAFAGQLNGAALLPQIIALADVDEEIESPEPEGGLDDLPVISPLRRRLLLSTLIQQWGLARGAPVPLHHALNSAGELGSFLDEAITQGVDLNRLKELAPAELAAHWAEVVSFLNIIAVQWPKLLEAENAVEAAVSRDRNLLALAQKLAAAPPQAPVIAAGSTGSIPATAELLKTVASLPTGAVVLPGLDTELDEASWHSLDPAHAQYGLSRLIAHIGATRVEIRPWSPLPETWPGRIARVTLLTEALRPPPTTDAWLDYVERAKDDAPVGLQNLALIEARTGRDEALAIACAMREALETPGRRAALVTPDRVLARRVAAELRRWDIGIDDSAGVPLSSTPPGAFLELLARAAAERFAPVPLLSLLKHPLASGNQDPGQFRHMVRELERAVLRGLRPEPGLPGIASRLEADRIRPALRRWFGELSRMLEPFALAMHGADADLGEIVQLHASAAETLAATPEKRGAERLWGGPSGESAAGLIRDLTRAGSSIALTPASHYADVFSEIGRMRAVRPKHNLHPRLSILGPLEARLLDFDLVILGGLNEGKWPAQTTTDPWLSRPMRAALGLESPERRVGLASHDFASLAASPAVLLTRALKENGSPTVASRWVLRLKQLAHGLGAQSMLGARNGLLHWTAELDRSAPVARARRPAPCPPTEARPKLLSVTEIETWIRDPYAIYAKHVLKLRPLDPIDQEPGPAERGSAVHRALEQFLKDFPDSLPGEAADELIRLGHAAFVAAGADQAALALWMPRFRRAAEWFVAYERERRKTISRSFVEVKGTLRLPGEFGFALKGRADRIDILHDGRATILDYKTGSAPSDKQIENLLSPQLPLEGAMLLAGAFGEVTPASLAEFVHVRLTGNDPPGLEQIAKVDANISAREARRLLENLVNRYADSSQPYFSRVQPFQMRDAGDYDHLARVLEWWRADEGET